MTNYFPSDAFLLWKIKSIHLAKETPQDIESQGSDGQERG